MNLRGNDLKLIITQGNFVTRKQTFIYNALSLKLKRKHRVKYNKNYNYLLILLKRKSRHYKTNIKIINQKHSKKTTIISLAKYSGTLGKLSQKLIESGQKHWTLTQLEAKWTKLKNISRVFEHNSPTFFQTSCWTRLRVSSWCSQFLPRFLHCRRRPLL